MRTESRLLQMFVAVADALSFTRAADALHVAQPWLSAQIRKLERQLGFELFIRDSRHVALSEQGAALLAPARAVMQALDAFNAGALLLRRQQEWPLLRIGLPPYSHLFAERVVLLERFAQIHPRLRIETVVGWSPELVEKVADEKLDMAFVVGDVIDPALEYRVVAQSSCELLCRRDDPLAQLDVVSDRDLHGRTVLVFERALNPPLYDQLFNGPKRAGAVLRVDHEMMSDLWLEHILANRALGLNFIRRPPAQLQEQLCARPMIDQRPVLLRLARRRGTPHPATELCWRMALAFEGIADAG